MHPTQTRCALLVALLIAAPASADWTQYGGNNQTFQTSGGSLPANLKIAWKRPLDAATSGVLAHKDVLYTQVATQQPSDSAPYREGFVALRVRDGETLWRTDYDAVRYDKQQTFGGMPVQPQATPALIDGVLVGLGYGGIVTGIDASDGRQLWQHDLVKTHKAPPVSFGFAGSPLAHAGRVYVLGGGKAGLLCLEPRSGKVLWKTACEAASYATPIVLRVGDSAHIVALTEDALFGVDPDSGRMLWRYAVSKPGMTNVPTPLDAGHGRVLISGQGIGGTRLLAIEPDDDAFAVREVWANRKAEFFYSNWFIRDGFVYGCDGGFLNVLRLDSGVAAWRSRGAQESNLTALGNEALVVHGKNGLSRMKLAGLDSAVTWHAQPDLGRCWVPPTIDGSRMLIRSETHLFCLQPAPPEQALPSAAWEHEPKRDTRTSLDKVGASRIEQIQTAFQDGGPDKAWETYLSIHQNHAKELRVPDRLELADMAAGEGMIDAARQVLQHAVEVYPESKPAHDALQKFLQQHPTGNE